MVAIARSRRAARLGVSERTVEEHLEHVFKKLGGPNRTSVASLYASLTR